MSEFSRRDWIKTVGAVSAGAMVPLPELIGGALFEAHKPIPDVQRIRELFAPGDIVDFYSTSEVFIPPRGRSNMKFSFDFPEPAVVYGDHRFGFLMFTEENTYSLDKSRMKTSVTPGGMVLTCDSFVWAGGQEKSLGKFSATFRQSGTTTTWDSVVEMAHPIKTTRLWCATCRVARCRWVAARWLILGRMICSPATRLVPVIYTGRERRSR